MRRFLADEDDFANIPKELRYKEIDAIDFMTQYNSVISYIASEIEDGAE